MAQIIMLHRSPRPDTMPAAATARSWTLRPRDVAMLLPAILPLTAAILLALLGWFVAWLAVVALLTGTIVTADLGRRTLRRLRGPVMAPLDREAVSFQGR